MTTPRWEDRRLSFGGWADVYDQWRPEYPAAAAHWLVAADPPAQVVDLGSGTGRLAVAVAALGHDVVAVEPDDGMRAVAEAALPGRTRAGSAEQIPVPDASADAVLAGQAYHWFDPARAIPEIARVLRPGGRLGIVWNVRDERVDWVRKFVEIVGGEDRMASMREPAPEVGAYFGPVERAVFAHVQEIDAEGLVSLASSYSYVAMRSDREAVLQSIRDLARTHPDLAGRGRFDLPYLANTFRAPRLPR